MVDLETIFVCLFPVELIVSIIWGIFISFKKDTNLAKVVRLVIASLIVIIELIQIALGILYIETTWLLLVGIYFRIFCINCVLIAMAVGDATNDYHKKQ